MYRGGWANGVRVDAAGTKYAAPPNFGQGTANPTTGNARLEFFDADDLVKRRNDAIKRRNAARGYPVGPVFGRIISRCD